LSDHERVGERRKKPGKRGGQIANHESEEIPTGSPEQVKGKKGYAKCKPDERREGNALFQTTCLVKRRTFEKSGTINSKDQKRRRERGRRDQ